MKILRGFLLILMAILITFPAQARQDGHQLYEGCKLAVEQTSEPEKRMNHPQAYDLGYCYGIVQGVSESLKDKEFFCLPEGINFAALATVVTDYLEAYPDQRNLKATAAAYHAMLTRYPCPRMRK